MSLSGRLALSIAGVVLGIIGAFALRHATQSVHDPQPEGSTIELVVSAHTHGEGGFSLDERVEALIVACRLEVRSDLVGPIEHQGPNRFRAVLTPAMDRSNRRQFRGCLEDWTLDHVRIDVLRLS